MRKLVFFFTILGFSALASASTARRASLPELVKHSSIVVVGTVASQSSAWEETRIYTTSELLLEEIWYQGGTADPAKLKLAEKTPAILVKTLGGVVGEIGQTVSGSPKLIRGHSYVLFLTGSPQDSFYIVGLSQGAFETQGDQLKPLSQLRETKLLGPNQAIPKSRIKLREAIIHSIRSKK